MYIIWVPGIEGNDKVGTLFKRNSSLRTINLENAKQRLN